MSAVLEARAVITATDQTKGAFDSLENRIKAASSQTKSLGAAMASIGRVSGPMSQVTGAISRAEAAVGAFGASAKAVDEVSAAVSRAARTMPQLAGQAQVLARAQAETARAGQQLAAELGRVDAAASRMGAFKALQTGFGEARRAFFGAKQGVQDLARQVEESDGRIVALRQRHAIAQAAQDRAAVAVPSHPGRAEAADPEGFARGRAAFVAGNDRYNAAVAERKAVAREIEDEVAANARLKRGYAGAQGEVSRMSSGLEQQKAALIGVKREMEELVGGPVKSLAGAEAALKAKVEGVNRAMVAQAQAAHGSAEAGAAALHAAETKAHGARSGHGGSQLAEVASLYGTIEAAEVAHRVVERYREFDKERRYGRVVMGLDDAGQAPLVDQAIHESGHSKFNDIQWLETQRELAARGYNKDQVLGFTPTVAQLGQSFDVSMPEAVKGLEGAMLAFRKDTSTKEKAEAAAQRTADLQVKASKISGMSFEDVVQLYKYAAAPAQMAHISEENMLAFGAISKKSNMGGDESGVAFRALAKNLISPTAGAQVAMQAAGIDYNAFQKMPDHLDTQGFVDQVAKKYGVKLTTEAQAGLGRIFSNRDILGDATRFMPAVTSYLKGELHGDDAKSLKSIAGLARGYRDASAGEVDTNGLMTAVIGAISKNPALANAIFGSKQGGRIYAALGEPDVLNHILDELHNQSQGFAKRVSDERMAGFDGAVSKLQNSVANVETALGRAWDGGGSGGLMTEATGAAARLMQSFAEASPVVQRAATEVSALGAAAAALKGFGLFKDGFGMGGAAVKLDGSAFNLDAAARALQVAAGEGGAAGAVPGVGGKAAGAAERRGVVGTVEHGGAALAKGALAAETLEIAAAGVTLSATTLLLGAVGAAVIIDAIKNSMEPKPRAADKPGFGRAFAPVTGGLDVTSPTLDHDAVEAKKPWFNRDGGAHPRGSVGSRRDTDQPGHWVDGPHGQRHWALEDRSGPKHPGFFVTAPLGPDGLPTLPMPAGLPADPYDRRTWARIGPDMPLRTATPFDPEAPAPVAPLPRGGVLAPIVPEPVVERAFHEARTKDDAASGAVRLAPASSAPVPVHVVSTAANLPAALVPPGMHRDFTLGNGTGSFSSPGLGADRGFQPFPGHHAPAVEAVPAHAVAPEIDLGALDAALGKTHETFDALKALGGMAVAPQVNMAAIDALIAKLIQAKSLIAGLGTASGTGTTGSTGPSRVVADPGVGKSR